MSPEKGFDLGDYIEVKDRVRILYELFPQARIETDYHLTSEPDAKPKVICRALVYRKPEDEKPAGYGTSWLYLPGSTPYTKGSEIENAETSAVGRAIGMLGILIAGGMATSNEIQNKAGEAAVNEDAFTPDGGLIGTATTQGTQDGELRQSPDGWTLPFRVKNGSKSYIVVAENALAEAIAAIKSEVIGKRVTVWGRWSDETIPAKGTKPQINYRLLHLERIQTPDVTLPAQLDDEPPLEEPPDDLHLIGEEPAA